MKIGIDLGGSHIGVGLINENNQIIAKQEHNWTEEEKVNMTNAIEKQCKKLIKQLLEKNNVSKIEKIGIGYPSANIIHGVVFLGQEEFNLPYILQQEFHVPVYLKNDAKCSGLCEKKIGNLQKYTNCLFMTLGTGIGGAYFYQNELVTPNYYQGFEIGHMVIKMDGRKCRCGKKGCFEEYAAMRIFRKEIETLFSISGLTSDKMFNILESQEKKEQVETVIESYTTYLSAGISNLINILEPDAICLGGSFAYYAPIFMNRLKEKVQSNFPGRTIPNLLVAKFANDAGIIGASMLENN